MENFKLFILGFSGYILVGMYDIAILYNKSSLKKFLSIGFLLTAAPYPFLFVAHTSLHSQPLRIGILAMISVFAILLIYSVFVETSLFSPRPGELYTKGTYGFSRHPGFLWYTIINLLVAEFLWNFRIMLQCLVCILCNFVLKLFEDTIIFPKIFPGYDKYKRQTPMVWSPHKRPCGEKIDD